MIWNDFRVNAASDRDTKRDVIREYRPSKTILGVICNSNRKAAQFPEDTRNLRAVEELERLAREIEALKGSDVYRQIDEAEDSLVAANAPDVWVDINEAVSRRARSIGFHGSHGAVGLLEWYRDPVRRSSRRP